MFQQYLNDALNGTKNHLVMAQCQHVIDLHIQKTVSVYNRKKTHINTAKIYTKKINRIQYIHNGKNFREYNWSFSQILIQYPRFRFIWSKSKYLNHTQAPIKYKKINKIQTFSPVVYLTRVASTVSNKACVVKSPRTSGSNKILFSFDTDSPPLRSCNDDIVS